MRTRWKAEWYETFTLRLGRGGWKSGVLCACCSLAAYSTPAKGRAMRERSV